MESQHSLEREWSNHEIIAKEDENFPFQYQLPSLDFSSYDLINVQDDHFDGASCFMDSMSNNYPIFSSKDILQDFIPFEDDFLIGGYGDQLGFQDQEMLVMNSLGFTNQEIYTVNSFGYQNQESVMNSLGFSIQERYTANSFGYQNQETLMNSLGFPYQTHQEIIAAKNVNHKQEIKMVRSECKEVEKEEDNNGVIGNGDGYGVNYQPPVMLSKEMISQYFYMPIKQAAEELNIGLTLLKKRCRELGIRRWPHRKLMSLQTLITNVQESKNCSGSRAKEVIELLEKEKKKMEEIPDLELKDETKRLRQSCFKANYKKRKTLNVNL